MQSGVFDFVENWENNEALAFSNTIALLKYADDLGFHEAWVGEHHFNHFTPSPAPIALISHALAYTQQIKIGSAAILLPHYHPIRLAEEIAVLDLLSRGRFLFGFARGAFPIFDRVMGDDVANNRKIMLDNAAIIHDLLFKDQVHFSGDFPAIKHVSIRPQPKGLIPFFIASLEEQTLIESARRGYNFLGFLTLSPQRAKALHTLFVENGALASFEFTLMRAIYIDEDGEKAREQAYKNAEIFSQCMLRANEANTTFEEILKTTDYEQFRFTFFNRDRILENMIVGTPQECLEQILALKHQVGITTLCIKPLSSNLEDSKSILKLYKEHIFPHI